MDDWLRYAIYGLAAALLLCGGLWIGLALLGIGAMGMILLSPRPVGDAMATTIWSALSAWPLVALPLFVWMGEILTRSNLSTQLFTGLAPLVRMLPGRLLHVNILGCALFAAICGSSAATVATVGKISLPELRRRGYPDAMAIGSLAGAGTLGLLIPPSIIMIVYGVAVNESISKLFIAGVVPGILLALLFSGYLVAWSLTVGRGQIPEEPPATTRMVGRVLALFPIFTLIVLVLGSIYLGFFTATEASSLGVLGALAIAYHDGTLDWPTFVAGLAGALKLSCMIGLILAGSAFVTLSMGYTGLPRALAEGIGSLGLSTMGLLVLLAVFYFVLGMFLDGISMVVLTMAVVEPIIRQAGIDMIWFGIFLIILVETAQITPPVGFNLFVLQSMTGSDIIYVARVAAPLCVVMVIMLVLIVQWPQIVLFLPSNI